MPQTLGRTSGWFQPCAGPLACRIGTASRSHVAKHGLPPASDSSSASIRDAIEHGMEHLALVFRQAFENACLHRLTDRHDLVEHFVALGCEFDGRKPPVACACVASGKAQRNQLRDTAADGKLIERACVADFLARKPGTATGDGENSPRGLRQTVSWPVIGGEQLSGAACDQKHSIGYPAIEPEGRL